MSLLSARAKWLFLQPPARLLWGCLGTTMAAFGVYVYLGLQWFSGLAVVLQLAGIVLTLWQLLELRKQLEVGGLPTLYRAWWKKFPRHQRLEVSLHINDSLHLHDATSSSVRPGRGGTTEEQVARLWEFTMSLDKQASDLSEALARHQRESRQALDDIHTKVDGQIGSLKRQVTEAVASSPFAALFGLWLVALSTGMQLALVFTGSPP